MTKPTIAFLGIGLMGAPMARNLLKAGFKVHLWNRTQHKAENLIADGGQVFEHPYEAVAGAQAVITMLETGQIVDSLVYQSRLLDSLEAGTLLIDMSSIPPSLAKQHARQCAIRGLAYLDAPVSGGTAGAEAASLSIMAGGSEEDFGRAQAIFSALGSQTTYIGPAGSGQLAKCANQAIVGITIGAVAEALLLAARGGANPAAVREALMGGFASSRILDLHGQRMLDRHFKPGATSRVQLKDLRTILDTAREEDLTLPLTEQAYNEYLELASKGLEDVDHSGLLLQLEAKNRTKLNREI
ncbi:NAD(P)-dependent oxidoreductase [Nitrincola sp. MINF-07-Sa-05]|uniref:NAD(P)-dependent oxidoreductase n=1 Tax=Nitrincola salilacus TaxID=3400273 RepID=UPI003918219F